MVGLFFYAYNWIGSFCFSGFVGWGGTVGEARIHLFSQVMACNTYVTPDSGFCVTYETRSMLILRRIGQKAFVYGKKFFEKFVS